MLKIEEIARVAHEINRAYCKALGDDSQPTWENAPEWQKDSARNGVKAHLEKLDLTPEQGHEVWLKQKIGEGWIWGPTKDTEAKLHPCMVPYADLPLEQKVKDHLFRQTVLSLSKINPNP